MRNRGLKTTLLLTTLALLAPLGVRGQSTDLTGTVVDSLTNEVLPSVFVSLGESSFGVLTDAFGRFAFVGLPAGPVQLTLEHLSYRTLVLELSEVPTDPLRVMLAPDAIELAGIRVRAQTQVMDAGRGISQVSIAPEQIQVLPSLGEPDIFRSLQLLPGVSGTNDATSGLLRAGWDPRRESGAPRRHDRLPRGPLLRHLQRLQRRCHQGRAALQVRVSGPLRRAHVQRGEHDREGGGSPGG